MYKILDQVTDAGYHILEMEMGEFKGVQWTYGRIAVGEDGENATLSFDYDVLNRELTDDEKTRFGQLLGDILIKILEEQLENNTAVYAGGTE